MIEEPTTPDLEELARRAVDAMNRRDHDAFIALSAQNVVWDTSRLGIGLFKGREAIRGFLEDWQGAYEDHSYELEEYRGLPNGVTFIVVHQRGRPAGSVGFVELRHAYVAIWGDGLVERGTVYADIDQARAAAERLAEERG